MLLFPDPKLPYIVITNAAGVAMGEVLLQDQGNGLQLLAFLSKRLTPKLCRLGIGMEKEWERNGNKNGVCPIPIPRWQWQGMGWEWG